MPFNLSIASLRSQTNLLFLFASYSGRGPSLDNKRQNNDWIALTLDLLCFPSALQNKKPLKRVLPDNKKMFVPRLKTLILSEILQCGFFSSFRPSTYSWFVCACVVIPNQADSCFCAHLLIHLRSYITVEGKEKAGANYRTGPNTQREQRYKGQRCILI